MCIRDRPGYAYPLLVWLHGPDADEGQLLRIMPIVSMRNYVAVAPRGLSIVRRGCNGEKLDWPQTPEHVYEAEQRVFEAVAAARERYNIAEQRVFLAGFDSGGTMAFRIAMGHPRRFGGVLSLAGRFPHGYAPFSQLTEARRLPVFLCVCRDSRQYSPVDACADLRLLHTAGMSVMLRQYPCGHELMPMMLRDLDRWIIDQITSGQDRCAEAFREERA